MHVLESVLYAEDLDKARTFYADLLGLPVISFDVTRSLFMKCDGSVLIVFKASKTLVPDAGVPSHGATGPGHLAFSASEDEIDEWRGRFESFGVAIIEEIRWKNGAHSIYFKDPAGNILEFATPNLWGF